MKSAPRGRDRTCCMWVMALSFAGTSVAGCGHARTVEPAKPPVEAKAEPPAAPKVRTGPHTFTSHHADPKANWGDEGVQLSTSPTALLKPGALSTIQERLAREGRLTGEPSGKLDAQTRAALEAFQRDRGLPATGIPDDATVGRLGLKAGDVFRSGAPPTDAQK